MFGEEIGTTNTGVSGPQGDCAGAKGEVYVANSNDSNALGYRAPSIVSNVTLNDSGEVPSDCSVDNEGDVAVANLCNTYCDAANIVIYKRGTGSPVPVTCPNILRYYFAAYDPNDNLWIDGMDTSYSFGYCEILAGKTIGQAVTLYPTPVFGGGLQWWHGYLTAVDQDAGTISVFRMNQFSGKLIKTVTLGDASDPVSYDIVRKYVVVSNAGSGSLSSYKFPGGGDPIDTLQGFSEPFGVVVVKSK